MALLWWRKKEELPEPVPIEVDAQIDWLGKRGLGPAPGLSRREWMEAADDPTDPFSLAEARIDGRLCVAPNLTFTATVPPPQLIEDMADALDLPIDEASVEGGTLTVRSAQQFFTYEINDRAAPAAPAGSTDPAAPTDPANPEGRSAQAGGSAGGSGLADLAEKVARDFIDAGHLLYRDGDTLAIVHRDLADILPLLSAGDEAAGSAEAD